MKPRVWAREVKTRSFQGGEQGRRCSVSLATGNQRHGSWGLLETIKRAFSADLSSPAAAWELLPGKTQAKRVSGSFLPSKAANSEELSEAPALQPLPHHSIAGGGTITAGYQVVPKNNVPRG